jgi:hypothetical protein
VPVYTFPATGNYSLFIHSDERNPLVYLGPNASVSTSNGLAIGGGSNLNIYRGFGQSVYAVVASGEYQLKAGSA